ncbi:unnamed protein product, partial [marine sediment metagenome]
GTKFSQTEYTGLQNQEKASLATSFDFEGNILTKTSYIYNVSGALDKAVTRNEAGTKLSETQYQGLQNQEKASLTTSFDFEGNILAKTTYIYDASGALDKAVTRNEAGTKLSETEYTGLTNQEKVSLATSFDLEGNILAKTTYIYDASGALDKAVTRNEAGTKLSETEYTGLTNQEKVSLATSFDLEGNILTKTSYIYNASGALDKAVTRNEAGTKLSETQYQGLQNQEKASLTTSFDLEGNI